MKIIVGRPTNDIALNGLEYLTEDIGGEEKEFNTIQEAKQYLLTNGCESFTDEDLENSFMFVRIKNKEIGTCEYCGESLYENDDDCCTFNEDGHEIMFCCPYHKDDYVHDLKH